MIYLFGVSPCYYWCYYRATILGIVGEAVIEGDTEKTEKNIYMYTHKKLDIGYNENQVGVAISILCIVV